MSSSYVKKKKKFSENTNLSIATTISNYRDHCC